MPLPDRYEGDGSWTSIRRPARQVDRSNFDLDSNQPGLLTQDKDRNCAGDA